MEEKKEPGQAFAVGDFVEKYSGDYTRKGVVCSVFQTPDNKTRYVVAHPPNIAAGDKGYILHIYSAANLRKQ